MFFTKFNHSTAYLLELLYDINNVTLADRTVCAKISLITSLTSRTLKKRKYLWLYFLDVNQTAEKFTVSTVLVTSQYIQ